MRTHPPVADHRLTTVLAVRNGVTESTYIAEAIIRWWRSACR